MKLSLIRCPLVLYQHLRLGGKMALTFGRNAHSGVASPQIVLSFVNSHLTFSRRLANVQTLPPRKAVTGLSLFLPTAKT